MKKIIIIAQNFLPESVGGASRIYEMARELQKSFYVEVICSPPTYPFTKFPKSNKLIKHDTMNGILIHRIWTYQPQKKNPTFFQRISYYTFHSIFAALYLMKKISGDTTVIVTNPPPTLLISSIIARLFRKKVVIDVRDLWIDAAVSLGFVKNKFIISCLKKFESYCLKKAWRIITNSFYIQKILKQQFENKKIEYIPFNVDLEQFHKKKCNIERDLVYIGNIGTAQNLEKLIYAISVIVKEIPKIKLEIYGGGDNEEILKQLINKLKLNYNIFIQNPIPRTDIPKILSSSRIGVIPLAENKELAYAIPTKTFEYLACELPVIAYGTSEELKRVVSQSSAGIFVKGDHLELGKNISMLLNNKKLIQEYGRNGRKFLMKQTNFSFLEE